MSPKNLPEDTWPVLLLSGQWSGPQKPLPAYMTLHESWLHGHVLGRIAEDTHPEHEHTWVTTVFEKNEHGAFVAVEIDHHLNDHIPKGPSGPVIPVKLGLAGARTRLHAKMKAHHERIDRALTERADTHPAMPVVKDPT